MADPGQLSICIATDAYLPSIGGVENHVLHLAAELRRLGHEAVVVTHPPPPMPNGALSQVESPAPVERLAGRLFLFREHDIAIDPRMVTSFRRLLERSRFDIVHGQSEGSYLVYEALAAARYRGVTTVLTRHSMIRNKPAVARPFLLFLTNLLARRADGLIAVSHSCAEESAGFPGLMRVIPNGVDIDEFRPMPYGRERLRADLGLAPDDVVLGYAGRLHTTKGIPLLMEVFAELHRENAKLRLVLAGPGPLRAAIAERAAASSGAIRLLDPQPFDKIAALLNTFDVFAFASKGEAFGISLLEAMACGLPSVAFGRWGVKELVADGETGLLAVGPADFAMKLRRLASDVALRQRLGQEARKSVAERFSWPHIAAATVDFYRELMAR
ncbi:MAG: glycosyltransferase family 4 protein [Phycisphaerae bacterium]|nr:glycosyltransferase family 4 protein [Phycisphaerae bacterium]